MHHPRNSAKILDAVNMKFRFLWLTASWMLLWMLLFGSNIYNNAPPAVGLIFTPEHNWASGSVYTACYLNLSQSSSNVTLHLLWCCHLQRPTSSLFLPQKKDKEIDFDSHTCTHTYKRYSWSNTMIILTKWPSEYKGGNAPQHMQLHLSIGQH